MSGRCTKNQGSSLGTKISVQLLGHIFYIKSENIKEKKKLIKL